jgi:two-component system response regulator QseB
MRVLIAEEDAILGQALANGLRQLGHFTERLRSGEEADAALHTEPYDAVVLDFGGNGGDAAHWLQRWRRRHMTMPVVVLLSQDSAELRRGAMDVGADDCLVKPVALHDLAGRLLELVGRASHGRAQHETWRHGDLEYDPTTKLVLWKGHSVELTARELALLEALLSNPQRVLPKAYLQDRMHEWHPGGPESGAVEVHVHHLRRKIDPGVVRTVRGLGYALGSCLVADEVVHPG